MSGQLGSTVTLTVDKGDGTTTPPIPGIPWFPGITVLQAMIIAQAMRPGAFNFLVNYHSIYGAFVESIDDAPEHDGMYWMLKIGTDISNYGPSEAIVIENPVGATIEIAWTLQIPPPEHGSAQLTRRLANRPRR